MTNTNTPEPVDVLAVMDEDRRVLVAKNSTSTMALAIAKHDAARAAVAELIAENAAMRELLRIQDEAMGAYRDLVELRNREIIALGGES